MLPLVINIVSNIPGILFRLLVLLVLLMFLAALIKNIHPILWTKGIINWIKKVFKDFGDLIPKQGDK